MPVLEDQTIAPSAPAPVESVVAASSPPAIEITPAPEPQAGVAAVPVHPDLDTATPKPDVAATTSAASGEAPAAETPKDAEGFKPTLLDKLDQPKTEAKADAEKPSPADPDPKAATEAQPETAPVELPKIDYFAGDTAIKLPDTLKMDDAQRGEFATALDAFRADPTKGAQAIIDMGVKAITAEAENLRRSQWDVWNKTQTDWQSQVMADPILGGAGHDTAMAFVGQGRNKLVSAHAPGTEGFNKDIADFNEMARITGVGNHPAFIRLLHRAGKLFAEAAPPPPDPRPTPDNGRRPGNKARDFYVNTNFPKSA